MTRFMRPASRLATVTLVGGACVSAMLGCEVKSGGKPLRRAVE